MKEDIVSVGLDGLGMQANPTFDASHKTPSTEAACHTSPSYTPTSYQVFFGAEYDDINPQTATAPASVTCDGQTVFTKDGYVYSCPASQPCSPPPGHPRDAMAAGRSGPESMHQFTRYARAALYLRAG